MTPVERLLAVARAEIGYVEKETNSQLDHPTANAGDEDWTKYARDLDALGIYNGRKNGYAWCDMFNDWCFITAFGLEVGMKLTCQPMGGYGAGCTSSAQYYQKKGQFHKDNPKPGDQIFFSRDGGKNMYHTGIVEKVQGGRVYTIEGNTSSSPGVVPNGGMVRDKSYALTYAQIGGYGRPDYSIIQGADLPAPPSSGAGDGTYTVQAGDSLSAIGQRLGVDWEAIAQTNGLAAPYTIYPGQILIIPTEEENDMDQATFDKMFDAAMTRYRKSLQDNDCGEWSREARDFVIRMGIFAGGGDGPDGQPNYMWGDFLTREQAAQILYRFAQAHGLA